MRLKQDAIIIASAIFIAPSLLISSGFIGFVGVIVYVGLVAVGVGVCVSVVEESVNTGTVQSAHLALSKVNLPSVLFTFVLAELLLNRNFCIKAVNSGCCDAGN